ncbi:fungal specific transcription factor domain-containing protein [Purpureocillium lilacinum]|uniref:Fungal specific transcription factor domain-containing protein n=1 Tax=Purpureocillium lilacinum TaxID=33203 RepID=A0A179GWI6_PURLI|nr:fungal specific transcription factor domain-containing protein [Purpureocillium lilacinum]
MPSRIVDGYEMNVAHRGSRFTLVEKSAGRPRTACYRCSALKVGPVRCTGERPSCHRCTRLHRRCIWTKDDSGLSRRDDASLSPGSREANKAIDESTSGTFGIPSSLLPKLVDLYFAHVDNASLLLHRPSFVQSLSTGSVTKHVVLSVCALAYNTLLDEGFARGWAEEAGRLAFSQVENPTEDNLVTFLNLTLFWYSQGQWQRMIVYEGNAACTSRVLGLGTSQSLAQNPSFSAELSRRRFWACFLINQFGNEAARCPKMNLADFEGIMLPCNEEDFEQEKFPPRHMHPGNREHQHRESYFAETSACQIAQDDRTDIHIKLLHIQELDKKLATWRPVPKEHRTRDFFKYLVSSDHERPALVNRTPLLFESSGSRSMRLLSNGIRADRPCSCSPDFINLPEMGIL